MTFDPGTNGQPVWSPDGSRIVFTSERDSAVYLCTKAASGIGGEEQILKGRAVPTDWSRDGRFIIYNDWGPNTKAGIWVLPLEGDRKPFPFAQMEFNEAEGVLSPDGRWLAYVSAESGKHEVYVRTSWQARGVRERRKVACLDQRRRVCQVAAGWEGVVTILPMTES